MRNLTLFNSALLAKQAWTIVRYPNSLVAKKFKVNYFPHCSILEARVSPVASYMWRPIVSVRPLLAKGLKRVMGDGREIDISQDPWVPSLPIFRVCNGDAPPADSASKVFELIKNGEWIRRYYADGFPAGKW